MGYFFNTATPENSPSATPLRFEAVDGSGVYIALQDRALPYRPISISGRQRAEFTWYPGSPNATVQMLGPEEGVISLRGFWKDRFIGQSTMVSARGERQVSAAVTGRSPDGNQAVTGEAVQPDLYILTVADLVSVFDEFRRAGRQLKLSWDTIIRYGHITSFTQTWHNAHDCEWELEFSVLSQEFPAAPVLSPRVADSSDLAAKAFKKLGDLSDTVDAWIADNDFSVVLSGLGEDALTVQAFATSIDATTRSWANSINNVAQNAVTIIQTPNEVGLSLLSAVTGPTVTLFKTAGAIVDSCIVFGGQFGGIEAALQGRDQDDVAFGLQIGQKSYATQVKQTIREIQTSNAIWRSQTTDAIQGPNTRIVVAQENTDLRDVSTRYYKTPDNWRALMLYNGLSDSKLMAGQIIKVPQRLDGAYSV